MAEGVTRPTVYPTLRYQDAPAAVAFLKEAFRFTAIAVYEELDGTVAHAELAYGNGLVMLGSTGREGPYSDAARGLGAASVYVVVADPDRHCEHARAHGARIVLPPADQDYGSRDYTASDPEGNLWTFGTYQPDFGAGLGT
ncbi:VOC family protein [Streptomyces capparidis]